LYRYFYNSLLALRGRFKVAAKLRYLCLKLFSARNARVIDYKKRPKRRNSLDNTEKGLDERIKTPRLQNPRTKIHAGAVGIGGEQTGIYPLSSPGGWRLIGTTPVKPYDPERDEPILYSAGDYIRFVPIDKETFDDISAKVQNGTYECRIIGGDGE